MEYSNLFTFFTDLKNFCDEFSPDILNLVNLLTVAPSSIDASKTSNISTNSDMLSNESPNLSSCNKISESSNELFLETEVQLNSATIHNNRYEGKFVRTNVINLSSQHLSRDEISLLSKGLKFVSKGDAAIDMCLSRLEEETLFLDEKLSYYNLTKGERNALYLLRDDPSIIIKEADKGSAVVVWDREDYLREANSQLSDKDVYQEVKGDAESPLMKVIKSVLRKIRNRVDISDKTLDYFFVNNPKLGGFFCFQRFTKDFIMFQVDQ